MSTEMLIPFRCLALTLTLYIGASGAEADRQTYGDVEVSEVVSIYDADTITVNVKSWPPIIGERIPIRIVGVDAPEIKGRCEAESRQALLAKQFVVTALRSAKTIELKGVGRDKYFRVDAQVLVDGRDIAALLVNEGLARAYDGAVRSGWCE